MKKVLLLMVAVLMISSVAMSAPHYGVYSDCSGSSCQLAAGFSSTNALVEKFSTGTTGCRLKVDFSTAPGTAFFSFVTPFVPIGQLNSDLSLGYGGCFSGTTCLGTIVASWGASGFVTVTASDGYPNIIYTDCSFAELVGHGGTANIGSTTGGCNEPNATQPSTWGQVKSLYR
jgi:hypothetical protein